MSPIDNSSEYLKIGDAARIMGVTRRTVYRRIWKGELPASKVGGIYLIRRADLEAMINQGRTVLPIQAEVSPVSALKCGACFRLLESDSQIAELCHAEGCDELICTQCWSDGVRHCTRHAPDRNQKWEQALQKHQSVEYPVLVKGANARLQEINFLNRIQARVMRVNASRRETFAGCQRAFHGAVRHDERTESAVPAYR